MEPACIYEDRRCVNGGFGEWPTIEIVKNVDTLSMEVSHIMIVYVMSGRIEASFGVTEGYQLTKGNLMLFPPGIKLDIRGGGSGTILTMKIVGRVVLCDKYVFGSVIKMIDSENVEHIHLEANDIIRTYMELLADNIAGRLQCFKYMELKITELFHYLRAYYRADQLAGFTQPLMSPNAQFMYFIWNNHRRVKTVAEFARLANCSLSAFKVKFRAVTGMSPSKWLNRQRAQNVFHDISTGEKSFKDISEEYHFSSVSHLGTFCRKNFGKSPGVIRPDKFKKIAGSSKI